MSKVAIRQECRKYAEKFIEVQRQGFKRLEVFGEWANPYLTMSYQYEAEIARALGEFVGQGSGLQRAQAGALVLLLQNGAGRSGSGI